MKVFLKFIFLFIAFSGFIWADDSFNLKTNEFAFFVFGNVIPYYKVFNYIAMLTQGGALNYLLALGVTIVSYFVAKKAYQGDLGGVIKNTVWALAISAFLLVPNSTLHIIDKRVDYGLISYPDNIKDKYNMDYSSY